MSVSTTQLESTPDKPLRQVSSDLSAEIQLSDDPVKLYDKAADLVQRAVKKTLGFTLYSGPTYWRSYHGLWWYR